MDVERVDGVDAQGQYLFGCLFTLAGWSGEDGHVNVFQFADVADDVIRRQFEGLVCRALPTDDAGEPEPPVYLCHCKGLDMDEALLVSRMESYGIPVLRQYPNNGAFGKLILGLSGSGVDIFVPASLWADACELLREPEEEREENQ